ncbi:uncharacterized protein [Palaemon carinicauda]|uniref:uncharacterized protein n=1 Tax=Palaemon carinicauda TaxID=392227 RepID=UPI0035B6555F
MDGILGDLSFCVCYVDVILEFSSLKEEHLRHLRTVRPPTTKRPCTITATLAPLYASIRGKPKDLKFGPLQEVTFCNAKNVLSTAADLTFPVPHAPRLLSTDASDVVIGAVLEQVVNG